MGIERRHLTIASMVIAALTRAGLGEVRYTLTDLGTFGGTWSEATCINNVGQIVGNATAPNETFAHGFLYSGARSVLIPLWQLPSGVGNDLFDEFYKHMESGKTRPEALALAMNRVRNTHPHPYFWGSLLLFGK